MSNVVRLEYAYGVCPKCKCGNYLRYLICKDGLTHKPYEVKCLNCNLYFKKEDIFGNGEETTPKPMTNADRIRAMTDEELADRIMGFVRCEACEREFHIECNPLMTCRGVWLEWLKRPVEVSE